MRPSSNEQTVALTEAESEAAVRVERFVSYFFLNSMTNRFSAGFPSSRV